VGQIGATGHQANQNSGKEVSKGRSKVGPEDETYWGEKGSWLGKEVHEGKHPGGRVKTKMYRRGCRGAKKEVKREEGGSGRRNTTCVKKKFQKNILWWGAIARKYGTLDEKWGGPQMGNEGL